MSEKKQKIFILLHGAWHNAQSWNKLIPLLEEAGHRVIAHDLPGHGQDKTPFTEINLKTYVDNVSTLINSLEQSVILVGHSKAGVTISQVAEIMPDKIDQLIYIAAFIPENGTSMLNEAQKSRTEGISGEMIFDQENKFIELKRSLIVKNCFYNRCTEEEANHALLNLQKEPLQPFLDPIIITEQKFGSVKKLYIECLDDQSVSYKDQRRMWQKAKCEVISIESDHSPFLSNPQKIAQILLNHIII